MMCHAELANPPLRAPSSPFSPRSGLGLTGTEGAGLVYPVLGILAAQSALCSKYYGSVARGAVLL